MHVSSCVSKAEQTPGTKVRVWDALCHGSFDIFLDFPYDMAAAAAVFLFNFCVAAAAAHSLTGARLYLSMLTHAVAVHILQVVLARVLGGPLKVL
jgi:hypothetical protein